MGLQKLLGISQEAPPKQANKKLVLALVHAPSSSLLTIPLCSELTLDICLLLQEGDGGEAREAGVRGSDWDVDMPQTVWTPAGLAGGWQETY